MTMETLPSAPQSGNPVTRFHRGFSYPFGATRFFRRHPSLLKFAFIPFLINIAVYSLLLFLSFHYFTDILNFFISKPDVWYMWLLYYIVGFLLAVIILLIFFFTFTIVGSLIASPFNDILSEQVEKIYAGNLQEQPFSFKKIPKILKQVLTEEGKKIAFFVSVQLMLLLLHLIPGIGNVLHPVLAGPITLIFLAWEFVDYGMGRRDLLFAEKRGIVLGNIFLMMGFGAAVSLILIIPVFNLICIPVCVVGGTLLFLDLNQSK